jgi:hypothetical protein
MQYNGTFTTTNTPILDNKHDDIMVLHVSHRDTCSSKEANRHAMHLQKEIGCYFFLLMTYQTKQDDVIMVMCPGHHGSAEKWQFYVMVTSRRKTKWVVGPARPTRVCTSGYV